MITKKTIKKVAKKIKRSNEAFKKFSPDQKRVLIAKDIIAGLVSEKIEAECGTYFYSHTVDLETAASLAKKTQLQDLFKKMPSCAVCMLGAISVCAVKRFNNFNCGKLKKVLGADSLREYKDDTLFARAVYSEYFSPEQVRLIETCFEGREIDGEDDMPSLDIQQKSVAWVFFNKYSDTSDRMAAIAQNIILHKGEFKPEVLVPSPLKTLLSKKRKNEKRAKTT